MAVKQGRIQYKTSSGTNEFRPRTDASVVEITPISGMSATDVQGALEELKASSGGGGLTVTQQNYSGLDGSTVISVPLNRDNVCVEFFWGERSGIGAKNMTLQFSNRTIVIAFNYVAGLIYVRFCPTYMPMSSWELQGLLEVYAREEDTDEMEFQQQYFVSTNSTYMDVSITYSSSQSPDAYAQWRVTSK